MSGQFGYALGVFFAAGGIGYIFLGLLWAIRVQPRWPATSYWLAATFALLVGVITAMSEPFLLTIVPSAAAAAYIVWRGRRDVRKKVAHKASLPA